MIRSLLHISKHTFSTNQIKYSQQKIINNCKPQDFFQLVYEVQNYNQFLPWCESSDILKRENFEYFEAELGVDFKLYQSSYVSKVYTQFDPKLQKYQVKSVSNSNQTLKVLESIWDIQPVKNYENKTEINYKINFEFQNSIYQSITKQIFQQIANSMMSTFESQFRSKQQNNYFIQNPIEIPSYYQQQQQQQDQINNNKIEQQELNQSKQQINQMQQQIQSEIENQQQQQDQLFIEESLQQIQKEGDQMLMQVFNKILELQQKNNKIQNHQIAQILKNVQESQEYREYLINGYSVLYFNQVAQHFQKTSQQQQQQQDFKFINFTQNSLNLDYDQGFYGTQQLVY